MHAILIFTGLLSAVAGFVMIAFGIPISAFGIGNLLITCGTMAAVGGVILVGLASVLRQLHRVADLLETRPVPAAVAVNENASATREPQLTPVSASLSAPETMSATSARSELSLSPLAPAPLSPSPSSPLSLDTRQSRTEPDAGMRNAAPDVRPHVPDTLSAGLAPEIVVNRDIASAPDAGTFPGNVGLAEPAPARPRPDRKTPPAADATGSGETKKREPMFSAGARARAELGLPAAGASGSPAAAAEARPAVIKSGVIEGMAYTLYADGSIDAELAGGTVKFNSIPDLRDYLGHTQRAS